ncbi:threonine/homoserine/homoserine lactone efflux protein [Saccharothrix saharensis]|uniref:Threonine/homoserine/homoserine lactone efflux protein n=1 Tax=Saccharothrix saharensis TaxID=571190 RepID=A0A543JI24_9PSEU|nr:LysE family translocator [Saccharothrix saharensis]TQM82510.1 threonine/homoserine/homoserine lactone efflux protein [Saccharothrix saharensis]
MWLAVFFGASVLVALTPGANNLLGMHHGVHHGPLRAATALLGRLAAFSLMVGAVVAGLGPVLAASGTALTVVKWVGVAYLVYLAVRILVTETGAEAPVGKGTPLRKEFLVAITNPKALLIFTAFVPQFVDPARGPIPLQLATLGAVYLAAEALAGTAYVALGAGIRKAGLTRRARARLDKGTAAVLLGMAGLLATGRT